MGYDLDLFVEKELCEKLICPICSDVLSNPADCKKCQNPFCTDCVIGWQKKNQSCPLCQDSPFEWKQSRFIKTLIEDLKIRCQVAGCEEVIKLGQKEQHQQVCKAFKVICSNACNGCTYSGIRGSLESHEQQCEFRLTLCIECQDIFLLSEQNNHNCIQSLKQEIRSLKLGFIQYQKKALKAVQRISQNLQIQAQPLLFQEAKDQGQHDYALNFTPFQIPGKLDYEVVQKNYQQAEKHIIDFELNILNIGAYA